MLVTVETNGWFWIGVSFATITRFKGFNARRAQNPH